MLGDPHSKKLPGEGEVAPTWLWLPFKRHFKEINRKYNTNWTQRLCSHRSSWLALFLTPEKLFCAKENVDLGFVG